MHTKWSLFALLAACRVPSNTAPTEPPDLAESLGLPDSHIAPTEQPIGVPAPPEDEGQHWCCQGIDQKALSGEGCWPIGKEHIASCNNVLYCDGAWSTQDGKVVCG